MRKLLICIVAALLSFLLCSCGGFATVEKQSAEAEGQKSMFVCVENAFFWKIVYHKETKVMYAVSDSDYNRGTFTLLVDADGNPLLWEGEYERTD